MYALRGYDFLLLQRRTKGRFFNWLFKRRVMARAWIELACIWQHLVCLVCTITCTVLLVGLDEAIIPPVQVDFVKSLCNSITSHEVAGTLVRYLIEKAIVLKNQTAFPDSPCNHRDDDSSYEYGTLMPLLQPSWSSGLNKTQGLIRMSNLCGSRAFTALLNHLLNCAPSSAYADSARQHSEATQSRNSLALPHHSTMVLCCLYRCRDSSNGMLRVTMIRLH